MNNHMNNQDSNLAEDVIHGLVIREVSLVSDHPHSSIGDCHSWHCGYLGHAQHES